MQARYYDPVTGRFLSVDPVSPSVGNSYNFNRYGYANENPVLNVDLDGKEPDPFFHPLTTLLSDSKVIAWYRSFQRESNRVSDQVLSRTSIDAVGTAAFGGGVYYSRPIYNSEAPRAGIVLVGQGLEAKSDVTFRLFTIDLPSTTNASSPLRFTADFSVHAIVGGHVQIEFDPSGHLSGYLGAGPGMGESFSWLSGGVLLKDGEKKAGNGQADGSRELSNGLNISGSLARPWDNVGCFCNRSERNSSLSE
jgi:hypothetical protein